MRGQAGQEARLQEGRFAAARRAIDQADAKGFFGVNRLDLRLPEADALGQAIAVARAGKQLEEEVGVVLVEGAQALGDDFDGSLI